MEKMVQIPTDGTGQPRLRISFDGGVGPGGLCGVGGLRAGGCAQR